MRIKKYRAKNMPEAMAMVRADLGPDAIILHSSTIKSPLGGVLGNPTLEVTAAADADLRDFPRQTPAAAQSIQEMQRELAAIKMTLSEVASSRRTGIGNLNSGLNDRYQRLRDMGITAGLAQQIVSAVAEELNHWAMEDTDVLDQHVRWHMQHRIPSFAPSRLEPNRQLVAFIVGPTGVGKTTTIAKLAANYAYAHGASVLIITTDTFRVAAVSQIMAFGEYLGIPVQVAHDPRQLAALVDKNRSFYDLILIDTPGRSQRNIQEIAEVERYVDAIADKKVYLSVNAGGRFEDLQHTVEVFGIMPVNGMILTKIDETLSLGAAYSLVCETGIPLSYLTMGQRVPDDIQTASADHLVDLMMGVPA
jgi:flagellar biosynthesis protein FlhF